MPATLMRRLRLAALLCAAALLSGCAAVTVSAISPADYLQQRRGDILTTGKLSAAASEVLRIIGSDIAACETNTGSCRADLARSELLSDEQRLATLSELWLARLRMARMTAPCRVTAACDRLSASCSTRMALLRAASRRSLPTDPSILPPWW